MGLTALGLDMVFILFLGVFIWSWFYSFDTSIFVN